MLNELNKRNTETVEQALKDMYSKIQEQQIRIDGLLNTLSILSAKLNTLELTLMLQKAKSMGTGPSEK